MHEADDAYMGYVGKEELIGFRNGLLEAERAGARVAAKSVQAANNVALAGLMRAVQHDEARWCAVLANAELHAAPLSGQQLLALWNALVRSARRSATVQR